MKSRSAHKIFLITLLIAVLTLSFFAGSINAASTVLTVEQSTGNPQVGDTLTVYLKISDIQNLYAFDILLEWNNSVIRIVSATNNLDASNHSDGVLNSPVFIIDENYSQSAGHYSLVATSVNPASSFNGSGTIATLTFTVLNTGDNGLKINNTTELEDYNPDESQSIPYTTQYTVSQDALSSAIERWGLLIAVLVIIIVAASIVIILLRRRKTKF